MIVLHAIPALSALQAFGKIATQGVRASGFAYHELLVSLGIVHTTNGMTTLTTLGHILAVFGFGLPVLNQFIGVIGEVDPPFLGSGNFSTPVTASFSTTLDSSISTSRARLKGSCLPTLISTIKARSQPSVHQSSQLRRRPRPLRRTPVLPHPR